MDDNDRLELLDRIADRVPELDLDQNEVEWMTLDDGHEALLVNGARLRWWPRWVFASAGDDLHVVGSLDPIVPGSVAS